MAVEVGNVCWGLLSHFLSGIKVSPRFYLDSSISTLCPGFSSEDEGDMMSKVRDDNTTLWKLSFRATKLTAGTEPESEPGRGLKPDCWETRNGFGT